jgi:transitional endoplasmic reticulum ATPase
MSDANRERIEALRQAVALSPAAAPLRRLLAEALQAGERHEEACDEYRTLLSGPGQVDGDLVRASTEAALACGDLEFAQWCLDRADASGVVEGLSLVRERVKEAMAASNVLRLVPRHANAPPEGERFRSELAPVRLDDIGGLADVKKLVNRLIVLPIRRPDLYSKYGRRSGGGVLLHGPPGCGKTMLARAIAGECQLPFFNVRLEDILDAYMGISERNLHEAFQTAREAAPCVLFFDEFDALAFSRSRHTSSGYRSIVDQLLQEMDAIGADNNGILVLASTNAPWDVDDALKRPGRLDRIIFVPPPDLEARARIFDLNAARTHSQRIDARRLAKLTPLYSGADIREVVERAVDFVIEEALDGGTEPPLTTAHIERAIEGMTPSTLEWLLRARNYVEFANAGDRYKDIEQFLRTKEVRKWKDFG